MYIQSAVMEEKKLLRREINRILNLIPEEQRRYKSRLICGRITESAFWKNASTVCAYLSFLREVETGFLVKRAREEGKTLGLPRISGHEIKFLDASSPDVRLTVHPFGFSEPAPDTPPLRFNSALLIIPGLAFDASGRRLGKGGGFYDRFLCSLPSEEEYVRVGIGFSEQLVPVVPVESQDIRMDFVMTEREMISCRGLDK